MGIRRFIVLGAIAGLLLGGVTAAQASLAIRRWEIGSVTCRHDGIHACAGVGQSTSGGSTGQNGTETSAVLGVDNNGQFTGVRADQFDFRPFGLRYAATIVTATAESSDAHAKVGQQTDYDGFTQPRHARETGVWAGQGDAAIWVGQHVDFNDNSCVLQVEIATVAPIEEPCPAGTEIPEIDKIPYTVPPGVTEQCFPNAC